MNGKQYRDSLRKMKHKVYIMGERISNPVDHPIVIPSQNAVAMTHDLAFDPKYEDLLTVTSSLTGKKVSRFTHIFQSVEDMVKKVKMARLLGKKTGTCFQRCATMDVANAMFMVTSEMDKKLGTHYHDRFLEFMREVQEKDYYVGVAMTDVKGDRSRRPHEQPILTYLHVVEEKRTESSRGPTNQTGSLNSNTRSAPTAARKNNRIMPWPCRTDGCEGSFTSMAATPEIPGNWRTAPSTWAIPNSAARKPCWSWIMSSSLGRGSFFIKRLSSRDGFPSFLRAVIASLTGAAKQG
jgi:hypothetical protein